MISFKNKKILITGATGGIGNELVKKFLRVLIIQKRFIITLENARFAGIF